MWGTWDYSLLAATSLSHAIHGHAWDPFTAYEFVTVGVWEGVGGVNFWLVEDDMGGKKCQLKVSGTMSSSFFLFRKNINLILLLFLLLLLLLSWLFCLFVCCCCSLAQLHEPDLPEDLLRTGSDSSLEFTSVCYGAQPLVFVGSDNGEYSLLV